MTTRKSERTLTQLEWFSVTYRSVWTHVALGLVVVLLAGGGWYYKFRLAPRNSASAAIATAEERLRQAAPLAEAHAHGATIEQATKALEQARSAWTAGEYGDARFAALHAADLAQRALDEAKGSGGERRLVKFYRIEGDVRVKHAGEFSWETATPSTALNVGDQVKTSSSASAQLVYFDGTETTIEPGSLLEIRDLFEDPVTKVRRVKQKLNFGEAQASTPERNVRGSFHELATDRIAARADKAASFRVAHDLEHGTTVVDAYRGQVEVESGDRRESLVEGDRIRAAADGQLLDRQALPGVPRLVAPADQRVIILDAQDVAQIPLAWEPVRGAARYRLQFSDRALFTNLLQDVVKEGTAARLDVGPGQYFWRASALGASGIEGPFSEARGFRVSSERIRDRSDNQPPALELSEFVTIGMMVIVNGRTEPGATLWVDNEKVEVHDDGRFYTVVRLRKEGLNELRLRAQDTAGNEAALVKSAFVETF